MTIIWCMVPEIWNRWRTESFVILDYFLPFYPPNNPKNQNFEKMKKEPRDITILHMNNINDNHMMYGSWDIERNGQDFLSFWTIFCPFTPSNNFKNQNFEKMKKKPGYNIILHKHTINDNHMMYGSRDMKCDRQNFLSFWTAFCPFTPLTTQKSKIFKNWKKSTWRYYHFTQRYQKSWSYAILFLKYGTHWI